MARVKGDDGWEVSGGKKGKGLGSANSSSGRGRGGGFSQERSGQGRGRGGFTNTNLNGRWGSSARSWDNNQPKPVQKPENSFNNVKPNNHNQWQGNQDLKKPAYVPPPLSNGWQWGNKHNSGASSNSANMDEKSNKKEGPSSSMSWRSILLPFEQSGEPAEAAVGDDDSDLGRHGSEDESEIDQFDSDEDFISSDEEGFNSDDTNLSHDTRKKNKWLKGFFDSLDTLSSEELNDSDRQWHCPACQACQGGVGAIDWYRGLQPVLSHAKSITSKRVKLHRKLADLLEEELRRRGAGCVISEESFGKWKGLLEPGSDREIIWPPMVIIQNTQLALDDNEKWLGMGNKELLDYFRNFKASKARHSYGPKGHRGVSALIFEDSALGYVEAKRLANQFIKEGRGKGEWERHPTRFYPGGQRILYGYYAEKEDLENFNQHSKGKTRLRYDMRSYYEMVVKRIRELNENNHKMHMLESQVSKQQDYSETLEESFGQVKTKLQMKEDEIMIIRQRATEQHEDHKKEMDFIEQTYRQQIDKQREHIEARELELEKMQKDFNRRAMDHYHELEADSANMLKGVKADTNEKQNEIDKEIARKKAIVEVSFKACEEYEKKREELIMEHDKRRKELKLKHLEQESQLERDLEKERRDLEKERTELLEKYLKKGQDAGYVIV